MASLRMLSMMATRLARPSIKPLGVRSMTLLSELKRQIEAPQEVPVPGDNPFALLALTAARPVSFGLDEDALRTTQKTLLRQYHPDHWAQQSKTLAAQAMRYTAAVNRAVDRLLDPVERGVIMLELKGSPLEEAAKADMPDSPEFLMMMMEMNEALEDGNADTLRSLGGMVQAHIDSCLNATAAAFEEDNPAQAKACVMKLRYLCNLRNKVQAQL